MFRGTVTDGAHAKSTVQALVDAWGGLDILVNNAAVYPVLPFALIEEEDWDRVMSINAKGAFLFSREAARPMIRQKRGSILNIGGFGEGRLVEAPVHYAASKAALRGFSDALAIELGRHGIKVNTLEPGLCNTGLSQRLPEGRVADYVAQCALGRLAAAEEIAELATFMVCDENTFMTGAKLVADGGV